MPRNRALYLSNFRWNRTHIHLLQLLNRREWIQKFRYEGIEQLLAILCQRRLRHNIRLIVWRCIVVLFLGGGRSWRFGHGHGRVQLDLFILLLLGHALTKPILDLGLLLLLPLELFLHSSLLLLLLLEEALLLLLELPLLLLDLLQLALLLLELGLPLRFLLLVERRLDLLLLLLQRHSFLVLLVAGHVCCSLLFLLLFLFLCRGLCLGVRGVSGLLQRSVHIQDASVRLNLRLTRWRALLVPLPPTTSAERHLNRLPIIAGSPVVFGEILCAVFMMGGCAGRPITIFSIVIVELLLVQAA